MCVGLNVRFQPLVLCSVGIILIENKGLNYKMRMYVKR